MPLEIRDTHFLIRSAQLVRGTRLEYALPGGGQETKTVKAVRSDPNYVSRLLLDCVPVFHKIITPAYFFYHSRPVAIYYFKGGL